MRREGVRGEGVTRGSEGGRGREGGSEGGEGEGEEKENFVYLLSIILLDELALETVNLFVPCKRVRRGERRTGGRSEDEKGEERGEEDRREE